jgi:hypothetical protein
MLSVGLYSLLGSITMTESSTKPEDVKALEENKQRLSIASSRPINKQTRARSASTSATPSLYSYMLSPRQAIQRYVFGFHAKTKRCLAEEAENGDEISIGSWIRDGHNPDELDAYGYTPLLNAAALGRLNAVTQLIKNGADVNKVGPFGFTPLHAAAQNGHREVVAALLKHGARIDAQNQDLDTPMHLALRSYHIEIVYMLIRNGGNAKVPGFQKKDCVQCANELGLKDVANTLKHYNPLVGYHPHSAPIVLNSMRPVFAM